MLDPKLLKEMLVSMKRIRAYELKISEKYSEQKMRCPTHLSVGQEAVPAALGMITTKEDLAVSTHRSHAHYLGKGGSGEKFIAEIYGKKTGCSAGKGGSMHLIDTSVGFMGSTAIVGGTIPVGVGLGLALKLEKTQNISIVFIGDAATEEGVFYESVNFAALQSIPVLFVCENNKYSVYSGLEVRQPEGRKIYEMVQAMGIKASHHDGNNVEECYKALESTIASMRDDGCPRFMEFDTYRWLEHCGPGYDNDIGYRTEQEFIHWKNKDPIKMLEEKLIRLKELDNNEILNIDKKVDEEVISAFNFAEKSPFPEASEAFYNIYKENML